MKKTALTIFTFLFLTASLWAQQTHQSFRIDYRAIPDANTSAIEKLSNPLFTAWVNNAYFKIDNSKFEGLIYVFDKTEQSSFALLPEAESYMLFDNTEDEESPVELVLDNVQQKKIAGYNCKLAKIVIDYDAKDDEQSVLEIWYTTDIPAFFWGEFQFFKQLKGAVLSLSVDGNGFEAVAVEKEALANDFFAIPDGYTEYVDEGDTDYENGQLAEDRFSYSNEENELMGLRDAEGNIITEPLYFHISYFSQDNIAVATNSEGKFGAIDKNGKTLLPFTYDYLSYDEASQEYLFGQQEKYGLLKKDGKVSVPAKYDMISFFNNGYALITVGDKSGLIDRNQKMVVPAVHEVLAEYNKTNYVVLEGENYVLYSIADNKKIIEQFDYLSLQQDSNLILALKKDKYGFIDDKGKTVIPFKFTFATLFIDGLASVAEDADQVEVYQINTKGERVETVEQ